MGISFSVKELNLCRLSRPSAACTLKGILVYFDTLGGAGCSKKLKEVLAVILVTGRIFFFSLVNKNFTPKWVFRNLQFLFRLEQRLAGHLLLALLLASANNPLALLVNFCDNAFESHHEIGPVLLRDSAANLITS